MKKEEEGILTKNKLQEGKDFPQINKEIKKLRESQVTFKENKREMVSLKREVKKLEEEVDKLKRQNFNLGLKAQEKKIEKKEKAEINLRYLNRIMMMLEGNKRMTIKELCDACCTTAGIVSPGLHFLEKYKVIQSHKDSDAKRYWIESNYPPIN